MSATPSVLNVVTTQFPDLKPDQAKALVLSALNWLTAVGAMASKRLDDPTQDAVVERRAQAIAFGVLAQMLSIKSADEQEQLNAITSIMNAITNPAPTPMGN